MKNKASLFGLYLPFFIVFTLSSVAFRAAALLVDFEFRSGYFDSKLLINIANAIAVLGAIILFTFIINGQKDVRLIPEFSNPQTVFVSILSAGALLFLAVFLAIRFFSIGYSSLKPSERVGAILILLSAVCALATAVYFVVGLLLEAHQGKLRAELAMLSLIFYAAYAAYLYFSTALPLNAPNKLVDQMAYLFTAAFFLYETRLALGRAIWRAYIAFGFVASLLCAYSSIPSIIYYMVEKKSVSDSIYESVLTFSLFLFIAIRTLMTGDLIIDKVSPKLNIIISAAEQRSEAVKEREDTAVQTQQQSDGLENQIALSDISDIDKTDEDKSKEEAEEERRLDLIDKIENLSTQEDG